MTENNKLRLQAESKLAQSPSPPVPLSPEAVQLTLHELRVHQIELEMQNEELRRAQTELEAVKARYFALYDLAPVGYITLAETGLILEVNLTAASLLGLARGNLVKQRLSRFILNEDQDLFYLSRKHLLSTREPQACELRCVNADGALLWAHLSMTLAPAPDNALVLYVMISDITKRKKAEEALQKKYAEIERFHLVTVGREVRMIELKKEINALLKAAGQPEKYRIVGE